jgi:hypothetical protein
MRVEGQRVSLHVEASTTAVGQASAMQNFHWHRRVGPRSRHLVWRRTVLAAVEVHAVALHVHAVEATL